jgi:hypothetical protein
MSKMFKDFGSGKGKAEPREVSFKLAEQEFHCAPVMSASALNEGFLATADSTGVMQATAIARLIRKTVLRDCSKCRELGILVPVQRIEDDEVKVEMVPDDYQRFVNLIDSDVEIESEVLGDIFMWLWGPAYTERPTDGPAPSGSGPSPVRVTSTGDLSLPGTPSREPSLAGTI